VINSGTILRTTIDDLTERISVVYNTPAINARGDRIGSTDAERFNCWAKVLPLTAKIEESGIERRADATYRIIIRYREGIKPDDEIIWRGNRLQMTAPPYDAESRKLWTVLECREAVEDGQA
jgi:SPP1 family predicted phage head-tail adaptor